MPRKFLHNNNRLPSQQQRNAEFPRNIILKRNIDYVSKGANPKAQGGFKTGSASQGIDLYEAVQNAIDNNWIDIPMPSGADGNGIYSGSGSTPNSLVEVENTADISFTGPISRVTIVNDIDNPTPVFNGQIGAGLIFENVDEGTLAGLGFDEEVFVIIASRLFYQGPTLLEGTLDVGNSNTPDDVVLSINPNPVKPQDNSFNDYRAQKTGLVYNEFGENPLTGIGGNYDDLINTSLAPKAITISGLENENVTVDANNTDLTINSLNSFNVNGVDLTNATTIADGTNSTDVVAWDTGNSEYVPKTVSFLGNITGTVNANSLTYEVKTDRLQQSQTYNTGDVEIILDYNSFLSTSPSITQSSSNTYEVGSASSDFAANGIRVLLNGTLSAASLVMNVEENPRRRYMVKIIDPSNMMIDPATVTVANNGANITRLTIDNDFDLAANVPCEILIKPVA